MMHAMDRMDAARYRDAALDAARWLESVAQPQEDEGLAWSAFPDVASDLYDNLGWGGLGVPLFLTDVYRATGESAWLELAERGARYVKRALEHARPNAECGLFKGFGGAAVVFGELNRATAD